MRREVKKSLRIQFLSFFISMAVLWTGIFMVVAYYRTEQKLNPTLEVFVSQKTESFDLSARKIKIDDSISKAVEEAMQPIAENPALSPRWVRTLVYGLSQKEAIANWMETRLKSFQHMLFMPKKKISL